MARPPERRRRFDPAVVGLDRGRRNAEQEHRVLELTAEPIARHHVLEEAALGIDEVVAREDEHGRVRVPLEDVGERQEDADGRAAVRGLAHQRSGERRRHRAGEVALVLLRDHGDDVALRHHRLHAIERVLQHRAGADERAVLLGPVLAEPALGHRPQPLAAAAGEDDRVGKLFRSAVAP